jgi:muramidase (phage lysozyme)
MRTITCLLVATLSTVIGCAAPEDAATDGTESAIGESCAAARGAGVGTRWDKAFHDTLAFGEGTEGVGKDGYNVQFTGRQFSSCARHPNVVRCSRGLCSTAAGRYQFLTTTWNSVARGISAENFEPETQEKGVAYLIERVRRVDLPNGRAMTAAEFSNAMSKLSYEWASLPPGRYGQPSHSLSEMRRDYCQNAGC